MRLRTAVLIFVACLTTAIGVAQPQIGGGTCNSASLSGNYAVSIGGRQVTAAGSLTSIIQTNGSANFDGLNKVTFTLISNTIQSAGTPQTWSGTYSIQANCAGIATLTSGSSAILNLAVYNQGNSFLVTGYDATTSYSGSGNTQAKQCSTSLLSGSYAFNATGFGFGGTTVNGITDASGLLQFDGLGKITANLTLSSTATPSNAVTATGSYSVASNCTGTATLTDSKANSYVMGLAISSGSATSSTDLFATFVQASKLTLIGAAHTVTGDTCNLSSLSGTYSLTLGGRAVSTSGTLTGSLQGNGTATFDGQGKVTLTGTANTNLATGKPFTYSGSYTVASNCSGTMTITATGPATLSLVVWSAGKQFNITGADTAYIYSGSGGNVRPEGCVNATLSGEYTYNASGFTQSGTTQNGAADESGVLQFDGQGNVTSTYTVSSPGTSTAMTATGTYSVSANCLASATLADSAGKSNTLNFSLLNQYSQGADLIAANSQFVRSGSAHAAFLNPTQSIGNVASYKVSATPPGSVFVLFGANLATRAAGAASAPLPTTLLSTSVTVNGQPVPLFYVDTDQIDAQMPWDVAPGTATVIVKNGTSSSNAVAVTVPATGTPGISVYGNNHAVVVNQDGGINSPTAGAAVGDQVVAYFTGGGPVQAAGKLVTGAGAPGGLSPVTGNSSVTVGSATAAIKYIGLTPGSIGLYQVNFVVPQLAKGTYPVVINIAGYASNNPVMTITN